MKYDVTLKELLHAPPPRLLQLLVGQEAVEMLTVEFPAVRMRRPDLVVRLADGALYHLELQTGNETDMPLRMLEYYLLLLRHYGESPRQQVLYVGAGTLTMKGELLYERLQFRYDVTDIRVLDGADLLNSPSIEDNVLALLCRGGNAPPVIRQIVERIARLPMKARADALTRVMILARLRQAEEIVQEETKQTEMEIDIREHPFLYDIFLQGEARGEARGETKGETALLRRQLVRRFGALPEWVKEKLAGAELEQLEDWGLRLLDAKRLEEVFALSDDGPAH